MGKTCCRTLVQALAVLIVLVCVREIHAECRVSMNGGLPTPEPLILDRGSSRDVFGFKQPSPGGVLVFSEGDTVRLVCTGPGNFLASLGPAHRDILATCAGDAFLYDAWPRPLAAFNCSRVSESATRTTPALCNHQRSRVIEVGFEVSEGEFYRSMDVCFDEVGLNAVWSKFDLVSSIRDGEIGLMRPPFEPGPHYHGMNPDILYRRPIQRDTVARIIGPEGAEHFIPRHPPDSRVYLSRGHLTASADFVYNVLKMSTYYFINAAPQWYSFNDGSWRELENSVRYFAHSRRLDLVVFTGTHGVATLPDTSGAEHQLYLDYDEHEGVGRIAVPAVYWKVLYHPLSQTGIAFVGVNNPHRQFEGVDNDPRYQLCENKINEPYWDMCRAYQREFQEVGFGYCCEVDDLRQSVTSLPPFTVIGVLE